MKKSLFKGEAFAIVAAVLWGINYPVVKAILNVVPESEFMLIRFAFALALLIFYTALTGEGFKIQFQHLGRILVLGILGVGLYNIIWTHGIHKTSAANAALLISTSPIFSGIYSALRKEETVDLRRWVGTIVALLGIFYIVKGAPGATFQFGSSTFVGDLLIIIGAILVALYSIVAKPLLEYYSSAKLTTFAMAGGLLVIAPYSIIGHGIPTLSKFTWQTWLGFSYVIVLGTVVAFVLWYKGVKLTSPVKALVYHYLIPVVSMILGFVFLGEKIYGGQIAGAILVFLGLLIVNSHFYLIKRIINIFNGA